MLDLTGKYWALMSIRFLTIFCGFHIDTDLIFNSIIVSPLFLDFRRIMWHGYVIKMHMHAVVRSAQHNHCYLCMRLVALVILRNLFMIKCPQEHGWRCTLIIYSEMYFVYCVSTNIRVIIFFVQNWSKTSLISKLKDLAERRKLADLTIGPVLTVCITYIFFSLLVYWTRI